MRRPHATLVAATLLASSWSCTGDAADVGTDTHGVSDAPTASASGEPPPELRLSTIDGATVPTRFILTVDLADATSAKLLTDGRFTAEQPGEPPRFHVELTPGRHELRVRAVVGDDEVRVDADITAAGPGDADGSTTISAPQGAAAASEPAHATDGIWAVSTTDALRSALGDASPGDVIVLADGEYRFDERLVASASGTSAAPITLRGARAAIIRTKNASGDYGLHVTGDHWSIEGLTVAHATKGIVLDGSVGTVIDGVEVYDIGDEAVHFRSCSSDGVLRNSFIHDTGRNSPQYGEGVYVGSANSNWSKYECADAIEQVGTGDNTERVLVEGNVFEDITAEGADLKEGTDSGIVRGNTFRRVGDSGKNSADSAVDAKGNGWLIEGNVVVEAASPWDDDGELRQSEFLDGFQSHAVYDGYGTANVFRGNRVDGEVPGFGIGLYPALDNVVTCDNEAPGAAEGLVGDADRPAPCSPV